MVIAAVDHEKASRAADTPTVVTRMVSSARRPVLASEASHEASAAVAARRVAVIPRVEISRDRAVVRATGKLIRRRQNDVCSIPVLAHAAHSIITTIPIFSYSLWLVGS